MNDPSVSGSSQYPNRSSSALPGPAGRLAVRAALLGVVLCYVAPSFVPLAGWIGHGVAHVAGVIEVGGMGHGEIANAGAIVSVRQPAGETHSHDGGAPHAHGPVVDALLEFDEAVPSQLTESVPPPSVELQLNVHVPATQALFAAVLPSNVFVHRAPIDRPRGAPPLPPAPPPRV